MKNKFSIDFNNLYNDKLQKKVNIIQTQKTIEQYFKNNQHSLFDNINEKDVEDILDCAQNIKQNFESMIVVGIGGSSLATQGLLNSIQSKGIKVIVLDNVDPDLVSKTLNSVDLKKTAFNIVSKSGNTVEILSILQIIIEKLKTKTAVKRQVFVTTTKKDNPLMRFANKYKVRVLGMPEDIVGRFSGLSAVGLLPCAVAGLDIKEILKGSKDILNLIKKDVINNDAFKFALLQYSMLKKGKNEMAILPYSNNLKDIFYYYSQTLAESLGKIDKCPTTVVMVGANCQHSFFEQVLEGNKYRYTMLVKLNKFGTDIKLENKEIIDSNCDYLSQIIKAECTSTLKTLTAHNRPAFIMNVENIDEQTVGALITFMQMTICYIGIFMKLNPFLQPAVEELKVNIHSLIKSKLN